MSLLNPTPLFSPDCPAPGGGHDNEGRVIWVRGRVVDIKHEAAPAVRRPRGTCDEHSDQVQVVLVLVGGSRKVSSLLNTFTVY